ncbi:MAG TPA: hypothetical protein QGF11_02980 [Acidimicrobiales bacterium]|jgi:hypothetical protein|nr:hypothetical protein [Acidimicrobiales bacterium]
MNKGRGLFIFAGAALVLCLALLLTPVSSQWADPCGSVLWPAKVWFSDGGELVHATTPPCNDARMDRVPMAAIIGVIGVGLGIVGLATRRSASGTDEAPPPARRSSQPNG